jgi:hypothetical protein
MEEGGATFSPESGSHRSKTAAGAPAAKLADVNADPAPLTQSTALGVGRALAAGQGREVLVRIYLPPLPRLIYTRPAGAS